ncbi:hypothetical protein [Arcobacter aquimarinus]
MNIETINLLIAIVLSINTIVLVPLFKFVFYMYKEVSYIKGHLNIK